MKNRKNGAEITFEIYSCKNQLIAASVSEELKTSKHNLSSVKHFEIDFLCSFHPTELFNIRSLQLNLGLSNSII